MLEEYPKKITLQDGSVLSLRPMSKDDQYPLYSFFVSLPEHDRKYLRNDVTDRKLLEKWARNLNYDKVLPILAVTDDRIVANATLNRQTFGWGRHVGEVRVTIDSDFQRRGLGSILLDEIAKLATKAQLKKLVARIITTRPEVIKAFEKAGFSQVTVLKNYVKDVYQRKYADIAIMVKDLA
ncbi:MAG: N-acetyltransferase family protein [Desulfobacteraceae bacterium]